MLMCMAASSSHDPNRCSYRTVADRVLAMRMVYRQQNMIPAVTFDFQNRQLMWQSFTVRFTRLAQGSNKAVLTLPAV